MPAMNIARQLPIRTTQRQFSLYNRASHCRGHSSSSRMEDKQNALRIGAAAVLLSTTAGLLTLQASPKGLPPERTTFGEVMPLDRYTSCAANTIEPMQRRPNAFEISTRALQGGRLTMEDEYVVADGGRFVAVFDGHGGGGVSAFLKRYLYRRLVENLQQEQGVSTSLSNYVQAIRSTFDQMEQEVLEDDTLEYQGSTAVAVMVFDSKDNEHRIVLSANCGDSRAILSRRGQAIELTRDHKPIDIREKERIVSMGEVIEWDKYSKVHRVRNLSLSRAIGDRYAKPVVSGDVEIKHFPSQRSDDEFVLLASDGLWDVMTSQEVVSFVHRRLQGEREKNSHSSDALDKDELEPVLRRNMAKFVAREALNRGSSDNICVVMVWLKDTDKINN